MECQHYPILSNMKDFDHSLHYPSTQFLTSASKLSQCPPDNGAEVAFAGRSNAGKSSAINILTCNKKLARTSKTPGRTQLINFFTITPTQRLVDLPGYGFAKVPLQVKRQWHKHLDEYLRLRHSLRGLILVMDIRHPLQEFDMMMLDWSHHTGIPIHILLTKADKLKHGPASNQLLQVRKQLSTASDRTSVQLFSALKKNGIEELRGKLNAWLSVQPA